ncbi:MAG: threonine/serine exporter family protein [Ruminococcaceae bacterium]|nr:threonine/serine exporter family protein [Oscillospiraceae bacterium]
MTNLFGYIIDIGEQMLLSGAEVHRVEESISRMGYALGAERVDVFIITSSMVVTFHTKNGETYTQTRRITTSNTDYEKLHQLNELSRNICDKRLSEIQITNQLELISNIKKAPIWVEIICFSIIAGAFTLFFGGNIKESVISLIIGAIVRITIYFPEMIISNKIFNKFLSTVIITLLTFLLLKCKIIMSADNIIIGNIMTLIPGIGLTNALRDLFTGDSIAGLLRLIEAVLMALAISAGYFLVTLWGGFVI